jgi:hypothetical protein
MNGRSKRGPRQASRILPFEQLEAMEDSAFPPSYCRNCDHPDHGHGKAVCRMRTHARFDGYTYNGRRYRKYDEVVCACPGFDVTFCLYCGRTKREHVKVDRHDRPIRWWQWQFAKLLCADHTSGGPKRPSRPDGVDNMWLPSTCWPGRPADCDEVSGTGPEVAVYRAIRSPARELRYRFVRQVERNRRELTRYQRDGTTENVRSDRIDISLRRPRA